MPACGRSQGPLPPPSTVPQVSEFEPTLSTSLHADFLYGKQINASSFKWRNSKWTGVIEDSIGHSSGCSVHSPFPYDLIINNRVHRTRAPTLRVLSVFAIAPTPAIISSLSNRFSSNDRGFDLVLLARFSWQKLPCSLTTQPSARHSTCNRAVRRKGPELKIQNIKPVATRPSLITGHTTRRRRLTHRVRLSSRPQLHRQI